MSIEDRPDPGEYTPEPDSVTAAEEYAPEGSVDESPSEADPADVAEQLAALPTDDDEGDPGPVATDPEAE